MRWTNPIQFRCGRAWLASACTLAVVGCAHESRRVPTPPQTSVKYSVHVAPGTPRYEEGEDEISNRPSPLEFPAPVYPDVAIALGLRRVEVSAKVIVNVEGRVDEVRIAAPPDPATHPIVFDDAVHEALLRWRYIPLTFRRFAEVKDDQGNIVDSRLVSSENRPFSLDYDFVFELRDGKPVVGSVPARR